MQFRQAIVNALADEMRSDSSHHSGEFHH